MNFMKMGSIMVMLPILDKIGEEKVKKYFLIWIALIMVMMTACSGEKNSSVNNASDDTATTSTGNEDNAFETAVIYYASYRSDIDDPALFKGLFSYEPEWIQREDGQDCLYSDVLNEIASDEFYATSTGEKYSEFITALKADDFNGYGLSYIDTQVRFSFAEESQMIQKMQDVLDTFDIGKCDFCFYPVTEDIYKTYGAFYDEHINGQTKGEFEENYFGEYKEFYYVNAIQVIDGIELKRFETYNSGDLVKYGEVSRIEFIYTSDGIEFLGIAHVYEIDGKKETVSLLSEQEARQLLSNKMNSLLETTASEEDYTSLKLIYIPVSLDATLDHEVEDVKSDNPVPTGSSFELVPAWCFATDKGSDGDVIYFNAVTGEEIV